MDVSKDPVSVRSSKLNQLFLGKNAKFFHKTLVGREGLLDALFTLYNECNNEYMMKNKFVANFVQKYRNSINELRALRVNISDFEVKSIIGRGHFGEVQVVREKQTGDVYAMKVMRKSETLSQQNIAFFEEERDIMAKANSPWITALQYAFQDNYNLHLVMEFHPGGDLLSLLERFDDRLEESMAKFYLAEIILAIHALHSMGYVHRDIKPDNILVDRTGHIKLADFGSSAKLTSNKTVSSKMPVGTPDYIAPEVLTAMNGGDSMYGAACDWWSLGVVAYEMSFGKTPFSDDKVSVTYSKIMNFMNSLQFPDDFQISRDAIDLIKGLLTESNKRLGYEALCKHAFFSDIDWTCIRQTLPPFVPTVNGLDDTSNFEDFEHETHFPTLEELKERRDFSGRDLPFIGFTYTNNLNVFTFESESITRNSGLSSPLIKTSLEQRLEQKCREFGEVMEKFHNLENQVSFLQTELDSLQIKQREKIETVKVLEMERENLEKNNAQAVSEITCLKRQLEMECNERSSTENKAFQLLEDIKEKYKRAEETRTEELRHELNEKNLIIVQLEQERLAAEHHAQKIKTDFEAAQKGCEDVQDQNSQLKARLNKMMGNNRTNVIDIHAQLEILIVDNQKMAIEFQQKLQQAKLESDEKIEILLRENSKLEKELYDAQSQILSTCNLQEKLDEFQEKYYLLETQLATQLHDKDDNLREKEREIEILKSKAEQLQKLLKEANNSVKKDRKLSERNIKDLEDELRIECQKFKEASEHINEKDNKITELTQRTNKLTTTVKTLEKQVAEYQQIVQVQMAQNADRKSEEYNNINEEKHFLETKVTHLKSQLDTLEHNLYAEKSIVQELEDKLSKVIATHELEMSEIKRKEHQDLQERNDSHETNLKKISELQIELKSLQVKNKELEIKLTTEANTFKMKNNELEFKLKNDSMVLKKDQGQQMKLKEEISQLRNELIKDKQLYKVSESECVKVQRENKKIQQTIEDLNQQVQNYKRQCNNQELTISTLQNTCTSLEEQIQDFESVNEQLEERNKKDLQEKKSLESNNRKLELQLQNNQKIIIADKISSESAENKIKTLEIQLTASKELHKTEVLTLQNHNEELKCIKTSLNKQLDELERKLSDLEINHKALQRKFAELEEDYLQLQEERSKLVNQLNSLKSSNFKLTQNLEEAIEKGEMLKTQKEDLQNSIENMQVAHEQEQIKREATIAQQTKLIDFLQVKTENMSKKKKGLSITPVRFFSKQKENISTTTIPLQWTEMQQLINKEKQTNQQLMDLLNKTRTELVSAKQESSRNKARNKDLRLIPQRSTSAISSTSNPIEPKSERIHHCIPHRLIYSVNLRANKCPVCLDTVHFGRTAAKCQDCNIVSHPKCSSTLSNSCGLSIQMAERFADQQSISSGSSENSCGDSAGNIQGWLKVPRTNRQGWDKKWVTLLDSKLSLYDNEVSTQPCDTFDLYIPDGEIIIHSAVSTAGIKTANCDLPFILRLELCPTTPTCPARSLYLMAPSFSAKQSWVSSLEIAASSNIDSSQLRSSHLLENPILTLNTGIDLNCILQLLDEVALVGAEDGLYYFDLQKQLLNKIVGVDKVLQLVILKEMDIILMITGNNHQLGVMNISSIARVLTNPDSQPGMKLVDDVTSCHLFCCEIVDDIPHICVAMAEKVIILKYNKQGNTFQLRKEFDTTVPCSCILFTESSVLIGADKFFSIGLEDYATEEFLDSSDTSLAFAIFGASQINLFPMALFKVSQAGLENEYLLCFNEFGVFVNGYGCRSREEDLSWTRLPLAFAFQEPYLFVIHSNYLTIHEIVPLSDERRTSEHALVPVSCPRYLGPSLIPGSIYLGTSNGHSVEVYIVCGNKSKLGRTSSESSLKRHGCSSRKQIFSQKGMVIISTIKVKQTEKIEDKHFAKKPRLSK